MKEKSGTTALHNTYIPQKKEEKRNECKEKKFLT